MERYQGSRVSDAAVKRGWPAFLFDPLIYDYEQLLELYAGYLSNIDVMQYADPNMSSDDMSVIRCQLQDAIGYEPTAEDISDLDSVCPERLFIKEMAEQLSTLTEGLTEFKGALNSAYTLSMSNMSIELTAASLNQLKIELYRAENKALVRANKYVYQYELSIAEGVCVLSSTRFVNLTIKFDTPGLIIV